MRGPRLPAHRAARPHALFTQLTLAAWASPAGPLLSALVTSTGAVTRTPGEDQAQNGEARGEERFSLREVQPHLCRGLGCCQLRVTGHFFRLRKEETTTSPEKG